MTETRLSVGEKLGISLLFISLITSSLLFKPTRLAWQEWQQERLAWEKSAAQLTQMEMLKKSREALAEKYAAVKNLLAPGEEGVAAAAAGMETAADEHQVSLILTLDDFPEKVDIGGSYQPGLGVKAELEGSYQGILAWTGAIERLPYLINWTDMELGQSRQVGQVKAEFNGTLFLQD